jgi:hypothetical protein
MATMSQQMQFQTPSPRLQHRSDGSSQSLVEAALSADIEGQRIFQ